MIPRYHYSCNHSFIGSELERLEQPPSSGVHT
jgi:hypothetical protein